MITFKFKSEKDKINGYYLLANKGKVRSLSGDIFEVNDDMLEVLSEERIDIDIIKKDMLDEADKIRNTPAIVV